MVHVIDAAKIRNVRSRCGSYVAGIQKPHQHSVLQNVGKSDVVEQIEVVAFEWLKHILSV